MTSLDDESDRVLISSTRNVLWLVGLKSSHTYDYHIRGICLRKQPLHHSARSCLLIVRLFWLHPLFLSFPPLDLIRFISLSYLLPYKWVPSLCFSLSSSSSSSSDYIVISHWCNYYLLLWEPSSSMVTKNITKIAEGKSAVLFLILLLNLSSSSSFLSSYVCVLWQTLVVSRKESTNRVVIATQGWMNLDNPSPGHSWDTWKHNIFCLPSERFICPFIFFFLLYVADDDSYTLHSSLRFVLLHKKWRVLFRSYPTRW